MTNESSLLDASSSSSREAGRTRTMPRGPFASSKGVGRAEPPWDALNRCEDVVVGRDDVYESWRADDDARAASPARVDAPPVMWEKGCSNLSDAYDVVVVGCGLSGAAIAERCSRALGMKVLILERRDHVGGNCYDYVDEKSDIRCSKYGAHLFHTKHQRVWEYVKKFSEWTPYEHRVRGRARASDGEMRLVPIPPTRETVNALFEDADVTNDAEMEAWYDAERIQPASGGAPANGEEAALARVGPRLYEAIFKHYTKKQWDKYPEELDASVLTRLPCRTTNDDRYFSDAWQALPRRGYTRIFENMLANDPNVTVRLECDYFEMKKSGKIPRHEFLVYTGQIDSYYAAMGMPKLEYRSVVFEEEYVEDADEGYYQEAMVVNYPGPDVPYTRIVEYKHLPNQPEGRHEKPGTIIAREYSSATGEPYYPVPNPANRALYEKYAELAAKEENVAFVGRLASYKYFNMDEAILNALEMFDNLRERGVLDPKRAPKDF